MPAGGKPSVTITYCRQCNFTARAAWLAQELLHTFAAELASVALVPGTGGVLEIAVDGEVLFSRQRVGRDPLLKEVKEALAARLGRPSRDPHAHLHGVDNP